MASNDQQILTKMYETMDVTLYEFLSNKGKAYMKKSLKDRKQFPQHFQILLSLLERYLRKVQFKYPHYILGPEYLVKLEYKGLPKKTIYLFGEKHIKIPEKASCSKQYSRITPFLESVFNTTHVPIDFFLEATPHDRYTQGIYGALTEKELLLKKGDSQNDIKVLRSKFDRCIIKKRKENCPSGVRIHYTDVRFLDTFPSLSHDLGSSDTFEKIVRMAQRNIDVELPLMKEQKFFRKIYKQIQHITKYPVVRKNLTELVSKIVVEYQNAFFNKNLELKSLEVFNEEYKTLVDLLTRSLKSKREEHYSNLYEKIVSVNKLILYANENKNRLSFRPAIKNACLVCLEEITAFFEEFSEKFMDLYTIARMFRSFKDSFDPMNIIFYGGVFHSKNIYSILETTGEFNITNYTGEGSPVCLDISKMNDKLF